MSSYQFNVYQLYSNIVSTLRAILVMIQVSRVVFFWGGGGGGGARARRSTLLPKGPGGGGGLDLFQSISAGRRITLNV